jgi:elongation factor 1 alpha-like protein
LPNYHRTEIPFFNQNSFLQFRKLMFQISYINTIIRDVKPFDFSGPSPDDEVMNKQNKAFTKKKVESVLTTVSEPLIVSTEPKVQPVVKKNLTPAQAKAAAAKKPTDKANIEQVTKDLDRMNIDDEMRKSSEIKKTPRKAVKQMSEARKKEVFNKIKEQPKGKDHLNMIVIGHVDAGKSTLMGHMLFLKGYVSQKTLAKYERDSRQIGKASFHYAWVLDEHEEERTRGITIDVAVNSFETDTKRITLLDAPGHRDFIPNMISGAAQADVGILVIRAGEGEFETAFSEDGQTKEHAILARSLGVTQLIVAVNQMDTVQWSQDRYDLIKREVLAFLKKVGFKDTQLSFVPCSGLSGENLIERKEPKLSAWYDGPTLYNRIDNFAPAVRDMERPFRLSISDVYKDSNQSGGVTIAGKIEAGVVSTGDKLLLMPANEVCTVKHVRMAQGEVVDFATAGENVDIALTGIDIKVINFGNILCDPENPINLVRTITAQIITFSMPHPLVRGQSLYMFLHNLNEPVVMKKLVSVLDSTTGEVKQKRPRCLMDKSTAIVEIQTEKPLLLETYSNYKQLGRFTLREGNQTVAAGIITDLAWTSDAPAKPASNTNTEASK